jgi:hypothetical protein
VTTATMSSDPQTVTGAPPVAAIILRGKVVEDNLIEFQGRGDSLTFLSPDPAAYVDQLPLTSPADLLDLYELSFEEILDYLEELGQRLDVRTNEHMRWARDLTYATSHMTKPLIDNVFLGVPSRFDRRRVIMQAESTVGLGYLNGWVETPLDDGMTAKVRAFGVRGLHIIPGNGPSSAVQTMIRCAFLRSDCIIKTPSNGPFAAVALGKTMCEMAPDHPITKHFAVAYWRGGDTEVEQRLCQPHKIDKIIAWGGFASVKHVTRYIQPGLELVALDPKSSASVIGSAALADDASLREAALRLAVDVGTGNQEPCSAARVAYVVTNDLETDLPAVNRLGEYVYQELCGLPAGLSTAPKSYDAELKSNVDSAGLQDDFYNVIGGEDGEGAVIVSQLPDPVDFATLLADRTVNIVPVESIEDAVSRFDSYTQTVGVWPEDVKASLVDIAPFYGVQRFVPLGYSSAHTQCTPHDGIELERRMCKWVVDLVVEPVPLSYAEDRISEELEAPPDVAIASTLEAVRKQA